MYPLPSQLENRFSIIETIVNGQKANILKIAPIGVEGATPLVLKLFHAAWLDRAGFTPTAFHEQLLLRKNLTHPLLTPILEAGTAEDRCFLIAPFVDGITLRKALRDEKSAVDFPFALTLIEELGQLLSFLAERGVDNRNIKLSNLLLNIHTKRFHIINLSVSRATQVQKGRDPFPGNEELHQAGDIYFLGTLLYETLIRESPIGPAGMLQSQWRDTFDRGMKSRFQNVKPSAVQGLHLFLERCFSRDRSKRLPCLSEWNKAYSHLLTKIRPEKSIALQISGANEIINAMQVVSVNFAAPGENGKNRPTTPREGGTGSKKSGTTPTPLKIRPLPSGKSSPAGKTLPLVTPKHPDNVVPLGNRKVSPKGTPTANQNPTAAPKNGDSMVWKESGDNSFERYLFNNLTLVAMGVGLFLYLLLRWL